MDFYLKVFLTAKVLLRQFFELLLNRFFGKNRHPGIRKDMNIPLDCMDLKAVFACESFCPVSSVLEGENDVSVRMISP